MSQFSFIFVALSISFTSFASFSDDELIQRREEIRRWANVCSYGGNDNVISLHGQAREKNICQQGDAILMAGLGCLAATLSGDVLTAKHRCQDVKEGQDLQGRWWRGVTAIENYYEEVTFSRDMGLGVLSYFLAQGFFQKDKLINQQVITQARSWIKWIESKADGSKMCLEKSSFVDNRCKINSGFGSLMYRVLKKIGAIDKTNESYKIIKKIKRLSKIYPDYFVAKESILQKELLTAINLTGDYEYHLKSVHVLLARLMAQKTTKPLNEVMRNVFRFEPRSPVYQILYRGINEQTKNELLRICPSTQEEVYLPVSWIERSLYPKAQTEWWPQRSYHKMSYKKANGHDCIYAINLFLAQKDRKLYLDDSPRRKCPRGTRKTQGMELNLSCLSPKLISASSCLQKGGALDSQKCRLKRRDYEMVYKVEGRCPDKTQFSGDIEGAAICESSKSIRLDKCNYFQNRFLKDGFCFKYQSGFWEKRKIKFKCPLGMKKLDMQEGWKWLLCKPVRVKKISRTDCPEVLWINGQASSYIKGKYCGKPEKGFFRAYEVE